MKKLLPLSLMVLTLSSCTLTIQRDGLNIRTMNFENMPSSPIKIGEFNKANIQLRVYYSNGKNAFYRVTEDWIPEQYQHYLGEPGTYTVTILFRHFQPNLSFTMVENNNAPIYNVTFLNYRGNVIENYAISHRRDAVFHGQIETREGYKFVGWDQSLFGVHQDMVYRPVYEINPDTLLD